MKSKCEKKEKKKRKEKKKKRLAEWKRYIVLRCSK